MFTVSVMGALGDTHGCGAETGLHLVVDAADQPRLNVTPMIDRIHHYNCHGDVGILASCWSVALPNAVECRPGLG